MAARRALAIGARLWPWLILLSAGAAVLALHAPGGSPARVAATLWFVLVCPGMAYVRLLSVGDVLIELGLAIALSISLAVVVSLAMVYLKLWHPDIALYALAATAVSGAMLQLCSGRRAHPEEQSA